MIRMDVIWNNANVLQGCCKYIRSLKELKIYRRFCGHRNAADSKTRHGVSVVEADDAGHGQEESACLRKANDLAWILWLKLVTTHVLRIDERPDKVCTLESGSIL